MLKVQFRKIKKQCPWFFFGFTHKKTLMYVQQNTVEVQNSWTELIKKIQIAKPTHTQVSLFTLL